MAGDRRLDQKERIREAVREGYGRIAKTGGSCCGPSCCGPGAAEKVAQGVGYSAAELAMLPEGANMGLSCGNPTALAGLKPGQVVLDLGSGGGFDVFVAAAKVGPSGRVIGVDMTAEMIAKARKSISAFTRKTGLSNVEFRLGEIEHLPVADSSVDVVISNCVINLAADKRRVLAEAFRVLKPGGRFAVSDVVVRGTLPPEVRRNMELWVGCVAGALEEEEFKGLLAASGFTDVSIEPTRVYAFEDARTFLAGTGLDADVLAREIGGRVMGAFVRATKPSDTFSPLRP
jgi:SAM-dependent methyltransferase